MFGVVQRRAVIGTLRAARGDAGPGVRAGPGGDRRGLGARYRPRRRPRLGARPGGRAPGDADDQRPLLRPLRLRRAAHGCSRWRRRPCSGLGAGVLSAVAPALEAARVEPVEALRRSGFESRARHLLPRVAVAGALLAAGGGALLRPGDALAGRELRRAVRDRARRGARGTAGDRHRHEASAAPLLGALLGTLGRLAARTVARSVSRTGVAVAALAVAVSVAIGVGLMIASFRSTVENWLDLTLRADVFVSAPSSGGARAFSTLPADVPATLAAVPGVAWVESFRSVHVASPLGEVNLGVADPRRARDVRLYRFADGDPAAAWDRVRAGAVIVTEPFAFRHAAAGPRGHGHAAERPRTAHVPGGGCLLRLRDRAGDRVHGPQRLRALLGRPGRLLARRAPCARRGDRRRRPGRARGARGQRAAGDPEPLAAPAGAARVRPHVRGDAVAAAAGGGGRFRRRVERADGAAARAHARARDPRDARARASAPVGA